MFLPVMHKENMANGGPLSKARNAKERTRVNDNTVQRALTSTKQTNENPSERTSANLDKQVKDQVDSSFV